MSSHLDTDLKVYFSGQKLYGDDFEQDEISEWFRDEEEGYSNLGARDRSKYVYHDHSINWLYGFRFLANTRFESALGLGSAYGDEFIPLAQNIEHISIVDPSAAFKTKDVAGTPVSYFKPSDTGNLPFEENRFDLITCFGVLHHIPNVSHVVSELCRCTRNGGVALIREPIVSMGDWRAPRRGLTKRERGIPFDIMNEIVQHAGFNIVRANYCMFPLSPRLWNLIGIRAYNSRVATIIDFVLSESFKWNDSYHRMTFLSKFCPVSGFWFLEKNRTS